MCHFGNCFTIIIRCGSSINTSSLYAVKAQTSLAPLSWFHGSRVTTAHAQQ